ncbi:crosslink repair DNA glycosylase YcaQ family protein [Dactylosporangium sp. AC04546]|uniref:DNA glycosylase AlkZ-like family protein n=1 Tax=Dactylosporangium sp. AC04546 TaxID=2862460 RepID=UPI001EDE3D8F|nr:crosslink repair DNA glycosylase YcaQ family protein [Dactylosporangium sp. AC04546]WVK81757.1 crosslink repair DNA glycosylase YcaQ family protein [Dactylosporangium sp. AC04546]
MPALDRRAVLAYRARANQLHERLDAEPEALAVLDLGVPNVPAGSARQALAARTTRPLGGDLALVWATRGAPHLHRRADLPALAAALWPLSDADATARFGSTQIPAGGALGLAAFTAAADAFSAVVLRETAKGDASRAVSDRVPAEVTYDCRACGAVHISGALFQQAGLAGGVQLDEPSAKTVLRPIEGWPGGPRAAAGTSGLLRAYLRLLGPATPGDAAKYLGTTVSAIRPAWPPDLAEVAVGGRKAWIPAEDLAGLLAAEPIAGVRLLPPSDPFLQARDRTVLTPDKAREKEVWRMLGNPGVLLHDGDLAGTWRGTVRRGRLEVALTPWVRLSAATRAAVEAEAQTVAAVRGLAGADLTESGR